MASRKSLKDSAETELTWAVSDIRRAWEAAWFSKEVTPAQWQSNLGQSRAADIFGPEQEPSRQATVHGHNPDVPDALNGIGNSGGDDFDPNHTRDAVRNFYGTDQTTDWRQACADTFAPAADNPEMEPDRTQRISR